MTDENNNDSEPTTNDSKSVAVEERSKESETTIEASTKSTVEESATKPEQTSNSSKDTETATAGSEESATAVGAGNTREKYIDKESSNPEPAALSESSEGKGQGSSVGENTENNTDTSSAAPGTAAVDEPASAATSDAPSGGPIVSSTKKTRPPYKFDPDKITLRFLFANRDGLTVTIECSPADTVGEVKGSLMSVWPEGLPDCYDGDQLRLVCMGKGYLMPDTRTLGECEIPVFKTHPTPINVSIRPEVKKDDDENTKGLHKREDSNNNSGGNGGNGRGGPGRSGQSIDTAAAQASQGCSCVIL